MNNLQAFLRTGSLSPTQNSAFSKISEMAKSNIHRQLKSSNSARNEITKEENDDKLSVLELEA